MHEERSLPRNWGSLKLLPEKYSICPCGHILRSSSVCYCMDWKQKRGRPHSFQLKWMSSLPSSLARLWVNKEFIDYLILLFVFVSWVHDLVLLGIPDFGIWGVEGKVGHLHLSPPPSPTPFSSPSPTFHTLYCWFGGHLGLDWDVPSVYLRSIMEMWWEPSPLFRNICHYYSFLSLRRKS